MFCVACGAEARGSFCENCGSSLHDEVQKSGQLFSVASAARPGFFRSKLAIAAGVLAVLFLAGSSVLFVMVNNAMSTQQASEALVAQNTRSLGQAESASSESFDAYMDWIGCSSATWICNVVYGNGDTLGAQWVEDAAQVDTYTTKLQQAKQSLARATAVTEELTLTLQIVAGSGVLSIGALLTGQLLSSSQKLNSNKNKKKSKVGK
jgi:hypothetical protein